MRVSSETFSMFASVAFAIGAAAAAAYALRNPEGANALLKQVLASTGQQDRQAASTNATAEAAGDDSSDMTTNNSSESDGDGEKLRAGATGHFEAEAEINGRSVPVMVDTGATLVALTYEDAERAGIFLRPSDFTHTASTANGIARIAPVRIDRITIGSISVRNVQGAVSERGKLHQTLLGMSFLGRLSRVEMRAGLLQLHE